MAGIGVHAFGWDPEICQFCNAFFIEQNIGSLDVSVDFFVAVEVHKPTDDRLEDGGYLVLGEFFLGDVEQVDDGAGVAVL